MVLSTSSFLDSIVMGSTSTAVSDAELEDNDSLGQQLAGYNITNADFLMQGDLSGSATVSSYPSQEFLKIARSTMQHQVLPTMASNKRKSSTAGGESSALNWRGIATSSSAAAANKRTVQPIDKLDLVKLSNPTTNMIMCPVCGREFYGKYKFQRHYIIHTGEKPFPCPYCPFRCNNKDNLKLHVVIKHFDK